jgi:hypothetical protein
MNWWNVESTGVITHRMPMTCLPQSEATGSYSSITLCRSLLTPRLTCKIIERGFPVHDFSYIHSDIVSIRASRHQRMFGGHPGGNESANSRVSGRFRMPSWPT